MTDGRPRGLATFFYERPRIASRLGTVGCRIRAASVGLLCRGVAYRKLEQCPLGLAIENFPITVVAGDPVPPPIDSRRRYRRMLTKRLVPCRVRAERIRRNFGAQSGFRLFLRIWR
jgi:hypothetical protein